MENNYFLDLNNINVNDNTEKKGRFTYLSWAWAWAELKKRYPDATYNVHKFGEDNKPYLFDEDLGYMVFTDVTVNGLTHEMWLPVMDFNNKAIQQGKATMMEINKAIMRCLVKNIGMHGIGLYIYAGEDLPEEDDGKQSTPKPKRTNSPKATDKQIGLIESLYSDVELDTMLTRLGKGLPQLTVEEASKMISARKGDK